MAKAVAKTKVKKKQWVPIHAPSSFNSVPLGETNVIDKEQVRTKSVTMNLMQITNNPRQQGYTIRFDITDIKEGKAQTQLIGVQMTPSHVKRQIRRHRDRIDDSFICQIAGGRLTRVKPMVITLNHASKAAQTEIRLMVRDKLRTLYKKMRFDDIVSDLIENKTQRLIKDICSKTHPIRNAEIRAISILPQSRELTEEVRAQIEKEAKEEEEKRQQLASAGAAASVEEEAVQETKKPRKRKKVEDAGESQVVEGPEDPGV